MQSGVRYLVREAFTWTAVVCLGFLGAYYYQDIVNHFSPLARSQHGSEASPRSDMAESGFERSVRLWADRNGHFAVDAHINDRPLSLIADTGATLVTLSYEDARSIGIPPADIDFTGRTRTANGVARVAPIKLRRVRVGPIVLHDVEAVIAEPGRLAVSLLGMSFLGALTRFEMRGRELVLIQ